MVQSKDAVQEQYSLHPYPFVAIEELVNNDQALLYRHSLVNAYYLRNRKIINTKGKKILDVGCGTGFKTLVLAEANPGAHVTGIDLSENSLNIARERLSHHGFSDVRFDAVSIDKIESLNEQFDYINCDDTLYLYPDLIQGLTTLKKALATNGIIRANLHSSLQRRAFLCAQEVFKFMGLMNSNPDDAEIDVVHDFMLSLHDDVATKILTWEPHLENEKFYYLMNYLLQADKGYETPEMFSALSACGLQFISMVDWATWDITGLFKNYQEISNNIKAFVEGLTTKQELRIFELLNPSHRLLDFWCGHTEDQQSFKIVSDWEIQEWYGATICLQPHVKSENLKKTLENSILVGKPFKIDLSFAIPQTPLYVDSSIAAWILFLWDKPQSFLTLLSYWRNVRPVDPATSKPIEENKLTEQLIDVLVGLESLSYILVEKGLIQVT